MKARHSFVGSDEVGAGFSVANEVPDQSLCDDARTRRRQELRALLQASRLSRRQSGNSVPHFLITGSIIRPNYGMCADCILSDLPSRRDAFQILIPGRHPAGP